MMRTVSDVMTTPVVVVHEGTPFQEIVATLARSRISAVPVLGNEDRLVGVVSEADLLHKTRDPEASRQGPLLESRKHRAERRKATGVSAADVMTQPVETISPRAHLAEAARLLHELDVKRLVVTDEGDRVVGIVSRRDLLKVFLRSDREIAEELSKEVVAPGILPTDAEVRVEVHDGVVMLKGTIGLKTLADVLVQLARRVDGVVDVQDQLTSRIDDRIPDG